jgi:hypothetical protein
VMRTGAVATPARNAIKLGVKLNKVTRLSFLCAPFSCHVHTARCSPLPIASSPFHASIVCLVTTRQRHCAAAHTCFQAQKKSPFMMFPPLCFVFWFAYSKCIVSVSWLSTPTGASQGCHQHTFARCHQARRAAQGYQEGDENPAPQGDCGRC